MFRSVALAIFAAWIFAASAAFTQAVEDPKHKGADKGQSPTPEKVTGKGKKGEKVVAPTAERLLIMIRSTIAALHHANVTEDYSVLHALMAPELRASVSVERLHQAFSNLRELGIDLSPVMILTPEITKAPEIGSNGELSVAGKFATPPYQAIFSMQFAAIDGRWRLSNLEVSIVNP